MIRQITSVQQMQGLGSAIGVNLLGGEVIELIGDVGAGKTTFTKGLAAGLGIDEDVQSPSFTLSREYTGRDGLELHHYDFYRLTEPGVLSYEIAESATNEVAITVVEWAESVHSVLPAERLKINFKYLPDESSRQIEITASENYDYLLKELD